MNDPGLCRRPLSCKQVKRGLVGCPVCGETKVEKAIMAPQLADRPPVNIISELCITSAT